MSGRKRRLQAGAMLVVCAIGTSSFRVSAQNDQERAGARALANDGAQAFEEKRWADAVDLFTRAESVVHAPPHWLLIARAQVQLGQLVSAREAYLNVIRDEIPAKAPKAFHEAQAAAKKELPQIEARIPMLAIKVNGGEQKRISVSVDGKPLPRGLIGASNPTDPGQHKVLAEAEGLTSGVQTVMLKEGARETITLTLRASGTPEPKPLPPPPAKAIETTTSPPTPPPPLETVSDTAPPTEPTARRSNGLRIASYAALGVGVVGLGAGSFFGLRSMSKRSQGDDICPNAKRCPNEDRGKVEALDDDAGQARLFSTVGFIAGGVGVASFVTLFLLSNKRHEESARARPALTVEPWIGPLGSGVHGTF